MPISLQTDEIEAHHRLELKPASHEWSNTLKRIGQCCAVFSVDTAVAHLSAGSECPTTLLLGDPPDWRWRPVPEDLDAPLWYPLCVDPSHPQAKGSPRTRINRGTSKVRRWLMPCSQRPSSTPAIAVIGCKNNGGTPKPPAKGPKVIHMLQT